MSTHADGPALLAVRRRYLAVALLGDRPAAASIAAELLAAGMEPQAIIAGVLVPTQVEIGQRWAARECTVGQEHTVTGITEAVLSSITVGFEPEPTRGHVVLACAEGEYHALPVRLFAEQLILDGWRVTSLGAAVPAEHLHGYLTGVDADVVGISCTVACNLSGAARSVTAARVAGHTVVVGGHGFGDDDHRARRLGAHGWIRPTASTARLDLDAVLWPDPTPPPRPGEWEVLERSRPGVVADALAWLRGHYPALMPSSPLRGTAAVDATSADLALTVGYLAGALVSEDPRVLVEHERWLRFTMGAHGYPDVVVDLEFRALAHATRQSAPAASALLLDVLGP